MNNQNNISKIPMLIAGLSLLALPAHAATTFLTNNSSPKTLASNEGDAGLGLTTGSADDGNNNGLDQDRAGASTVLILSADDGGGPITFNTTNVSGGNRLFMDGDSMGHGNDKWGNSQNWTFSLDQTISFDALTFIVINETMTLQSDAWIGDANANAITPASRNWSFDGTTGTFSILGAGALGGAGTYDFSTAGVSDVDAGTAITFGFIGGANGGEQLSSFTITPVVPVPEPSSTALLGLGGLALVLRRSK